MQAVSGASGPHREHQVRAWFASGSTGPTTPHGRLGLLATGLTHHSDDPADLDGGGFWAVVQTFEGRLDLWRFADVRSAPAPPPTTPWTPVVEPWDDSLPEPAYRRGVRDIRRRIRDGLVYQVNLCRVLSTASPARPDPWALAAVLARGNPAPYATVLDIPAGPEAPGAWIVSASPELFLRRRDRAVRSSPIKGTGRTASDLLAKDDAENIMIVDLVRNDLQRVCEPGSVEVTALLRTQSHPGLVHLVSTVAGRLEDRAGWPELLAALSPPGSVSGAPKSSALRTIGELEPAARGPYCGAIGWVDADAGTAALAVGIRTFWWEGGRLHFGTGAGITWDSDPAREWQETELKASRLIALAAGAGTAESATAAVDLAGQQGVAVPRGGS